MHNYLDKTKLTMVARSEDVTLYKLDTPKLLNKYFITTYEGSRRLLTTPEEVGFQTYLDTMPPTVEALKYFRKKGLQDSVDILTILRGGLNYSVEESCFRAGIQTDNINFLSCERIIQNKEIKGLDIKYQKYNIVNNGTMIIGDIIATGDTLKLCFDYILDKYKRRGAKLRRVIFFTIGGTRAFDLMETFTEQIRQYWPEFEGFTCVFYEGIFSVYSTRGVTGVNVPDIDFYWHNSVLAPEYRKTVLNSDNAIFEKCIIYDGGARRYEIAEHYDEVLEYWRDIRAVADNVNMKAFTDEKLGYPSPASYEEWLEINHYEEDTTNEEHVLKALFRSEEAFRHKNHKRNLRHIAEVRLQEITKAFEKYKK